MTDFLCKACNGTGRAELAAPAADATQGALALYLNEVQPVDGRAQINVSIDELMVLRHLAGATVLSTSQPEHAEIDDVPRGEFEIVRTASRMFEDAANVWMERAIKAEAAAAQPTPHQAAAGEEREVLAAYLNHCGIDNESGGNSGPWVLIKPEKRDEIVAVLLAAQPASPLRGRDATIEECARLAETLSVKDNWSPGYKRAAAIIAKKMRALSAPPELPADPLSDLIAGFAKALLAKLRLASANGRSGWERDDWEKQCQQELLRHLQKGDPRDVAAYCAFMWHHDWITAPEQPAAYPVAAYPVAAPAAPEPRLEKAVEILRRRATGYEDRATALFNGRIMADELRANAREIELLADSTAGGDRVEGY